MRVFLAFAVPIMAMTSLIGCSRSPSPTVFLDPALAVLAPADTTLLAGIRMQKLRSASFFNEFVKDSPRLRQFRENAGLQDEADVWEYLIASNGSEWVALMRGKFSEMGMEPRSKKPGAMRISHRGVSILGDERGAVAFLNPTTAIAGQFNVVKRVLEERTANSGIPNRLQRLAGEIPSSNEAWLVSIGPAPAVFPVTEVASARVGLNLQNRTFAMKVEAQSLGDAQEVARSLAGRTEGRTITAEGPIPSNVLEWVLGKALPD